MITVVVGDDTSVSTVRKINIDLDDSYHMVMSLTIELNSSGSVGRLPTEAGTACILPCIGCRDLGYLHDAGSCPSATHIWERVIPGGEVHCHWKEPSLATVQERLAIDTTSSGPGGTGGSVELGCRNVIDRGVTVERDNILSFALLV